DSVSIDDSTIPVCRETTYLAYVLCAGKGQVEQPQPRPMPPVRSFRRDPSCSAIVRRRTRDVLYVLAVHPYTACMDAGARRPAANRQDNARLWRADAFGGLELLRAQFVAFNFSPHAHEEFMIVVTDEGTALPRFWGAVQRVGPGDVFVLSPGEVHGGGPAEGSIWCYRSFYPPAALMQRVVREL